jgi:hypothetical protein
MIKKECLQKVFVILHLSLCSSISQVSNKQKRKRNAIANWSNLPLVGDQIKSYGSFLQGYASSYSVRTVIWNFLSACTTQKYCKWTFPRSKSNCNFFNILILLVPEGVTKHWRLHENLLSICSTKIYLACMSNMYTFASHHNIQQDQRI